MNVSTDDLMQDLLIFYPNGNYPARPQVASARRFGDWAKIATPNPANHNYGYKVRLAQRTDSLRLLRAFATGAVYYDPGIKLEHASSEKPSHKKRSQFRVASKNIAALYEMVETVEV